VSFAGDHGHKGRFFNGPQRVDSIQPLDPVYYYKELVGQDAAATHHVG